MNQELLRKAQLTQLEIAKEIIRICDLYQIDYWLDSGTLLGAVRHKGFIPWDDDMDLGMMRKDYERFLKIAPFELNEKYELVDWHSVQDYSGSFCKIMKRNTIYRENNTPRSTKCGIWVDIFPYDNYPKDKDITLQQICMIILRAMIRAKCGWCTWRTDGKIIVSKWIKNLPFRMASCFFTKKQLVYLFEKCATYYNNTQRGYVFTQSVDSYGGWVVPKTCFEEKVLLQFEDSKYCCPSGFDTYLKRCYGDYMVPPPVEKRGDRHKIIEIDLGE